MRTVYCNGHYVGENRAHVSVFDRSVLFADAIYEVISILDGQLLDMDWHLERFQRSARALDFAQLPDPNEWQKIIAELQTANGLNEGIIYCQMSRGSIGDRDFCYPPPEACPNKIAFSQAKNLRGNAMAKSGMAVITRPDLRWHRRDIKTTQLLYPVMMKMEAKTHGADDVWLIDQGVVTEGASQNAWILDGDNVLRTHPLDQNILHGVTRRRVQQVARDMGLEIIEQPFTVAEAQAAKEAFVTSASLFVMPVIAIDGVAIGTGKAGEIAQGLRSAYIEAALASAADRQSQEQD